MYECRLSCQNASILKLHRHLGTWARGYAVNLLPASARIIACHTVVIESQHNTSRNADSQTIVQ